MYNIKLILLFLLFCLPLFAKKIVRVGHFPNLTHAQGVIGHHLSRQNNGWFEAILGPDIEVQWFVYADGPSAMEALFAHAVDMTYVGPNPAINAFIRSKGKGFRIISGACSGGSALVVNPEKIKSVADFKGKKVATPQFGSTQDIAARAWLLSQGFKISLTGGEVSVLPVSHASQFILFKQGELDAAWSIEPWVSRLVLEANGKIFLEESALWPETKGKYVTTHLVADQKFIESDPDVAQKWVSGHISLTNWLNAHPEEAKKMFNTELKEEIKHTISESVLNRAWKNIELTYDPIQTSLFRDAAQAFQVGFLKEKPDLSGIYDLQFLTTALQNEQEKS